MTRAPGANAQSAYARSITAGLPEPMLPNVWLVDRGSPSPLARPSTTFAFVVTCASATSRARKRMRLRSAASSTCASGPLPTTRSVAMFSSRTRRSPLSLILAAQSAPLTLPISSAASAPCWRSSPASACSASISASRAWIAPLSWSTWARRPAFTAASSSRRAAIRCISISILACAACNSLSPGPAPAWTEATGATHRRQAATAAARTLVPTTVPSIWRGCHFKGQGARRRHPLPRGATQNL
jgi:hypothetical protein